MAYRWQTCLRDGMVPVELSVYYSDLVRYVTAHQEQRGEPPSSSIIAGRGGDTDGHQPLTPRSFCLVSIALAIEASAGEMNAHGRCRLASTRRSRCWHTDTAGGLLMLCP